MPNLFDDLSADGRDAARFLRHNKVCTERRKTGECSHPGCAAAAYYADVVDQLVNAACGQATAERRAA